MKPARWAGAIVVMLALALAVVHLRAEQARCAARMLKSEGDRIALRGELWELQASVARLKSPVEIHDRLRRLRELAAAKAEDSTVPDSSTLTLTHR